MLIRVCALSVVAMLTSGAALAQEKPKPLGPAPTTQPAESAAEPLCPVMGEPIDRRSYTYDRGKRVYFCCERCKGTFESEPDRYVEGVRKQSDALPTLRVQVRCPGGEPLENRRVFVEEEEGRVYFCSERCKEHWERGDDKLTVSLHDRGYTYQVRCPCGGGEVDPAISRRYGSDTVYFCCEGCIPGFEKDKKAGLKSIAEQVRRNHERFQNRSHRDIKSPAMPRTSEGPGRG